MGGHLLGSCHGTIETILDHVGFEHGTLEVDVMIGEGFELGCEHPLGGGGTSVNVMIAIGNNLRLNNGHETNRLADQGILGKLIGSLTDGKVRWETIGRVDLEDISPLGKVSTGSVSFLGPLLQGIHALVHGLWVAKRSDLCSRNASFIIPGIKLNPRNHTPSIDKIHHLLPLRIHLKQRLGMKNNTPNTLAKSRSLVTHAAIRGAVLGIIGNGLGAGMAGAEPRAGGLVGGEEALAGCAEG